MRLCGGIYRLLCCLATLIWMAAVITQAVPAGAVVYTWNGGSGNWENAANWTPLIGPPNGYDQVIIPFGSVTLSSCCYSVSQLSLGPAASLEIPLWHLEFLSTASPPQVTVTNDGIIELTCNGGIGAFLSTHNSLVTLTGSGEVAMIGVSNGISDSGYGGSLVNDTDHTIRGGGTIDVNMTNKGQIIADSGLKVYKTITNQGGTISILGTSTLRVERGGIIGGSLNPGDGDLLLLDGAKVGNLALGPGHIYIGGTYGGTYFLGNVTLAATSTLQVEVGTYHLSKAPDNTLPKLTNQTTFKMWGATSKLIFDQWMATLTGSGQLVLGGNFDNEIATTVNGQLTNDLNHCIEGGGLISCPIFNKGTIIANNGGTLTFTNHIYNQGALIADNGVLKFSQAPLECTGSVTGSVTIRDNSILKILPGTTGAVFQTGNLSLSQLAALDAEGKVDLKGDFAFAMTEQARWYWPWFDNGFTMSGGASIKQSLEVGGRDYGSSAEGFSNNFNLPTLNLSSPGTYVYLADNIDNGNRSPGVKEALYTQSLSVPVGTTLNLNRIHFYTYLYGNLHRVQAGDDLYFGGGRIIDTPEGPISPVAPLLLLLLD